MRLTLSPDRRRLARRTGDGRPGRRPVIEPLGAARRAWRASVRIPRPCTAKTATPRMSCASAGRRTFLRRTFVLLIGVAVVVLFVPASAAHAEPAMVLALAGSVDQVLDNIRNWLMGILAGLATVFLTVGGVRRVVGGGDPGEQEKAKSCFKNAAIGYGLAALAPLAITVLKSIVGA